jgi:hypothetical protein
VKFNIFMHSIKAFHIGEGSINKCFRILNRFEVNRLKGQTLNIDNQLNVALSLMHLQYNVQHEKKLFF